MFRTCKDCRKDIYWIDDLGRWYHRDSVDMLLCTAETVEPAEVEV